MPNILLTEECVRSCPYCFAKKYMDSSNHKFISWEDFIYIVDLFERSHMNNQLSLLGGEPSVHKDFTEFILYLIEQKLRGYRFYLRDYVTEETGSPGYKPGAISATSGPFCCKPEPSIHVHG